MSLTKKENTRKASERVPTKSRTSETHYRLLAERSFDLVVAQDMDRKMVYVNHVWVNTLGYTAEETLGRSTSDFVAPEYIEEGKKRNLQRKAGDASTFQYELELLSKTGERIPVEVHSSPIVAESGEFLEILLVARDLREQKKTQAALVESEARYHGLFEGTPIAIWENDFSEIKKYIDELKKGGVEDFTVFFRNNPDILRECTQRIKIIDVNQAAAELHGVESKEKLFSLDLGEIYPKDSLAVFANALVALIKGETRIQAETPAKKMDGTIFHQSVTWRVMPGHEETWARVITSALDISKLKNTEGELKQKLDDLNTLQATAFACSHATSVHSLIREITNIIGYTLYPDIYGILILDKNKHTLTPHSSYSFIPEHQQGISLDISEGITGKVATTQKAIRIDDIRKSKEYIPSSPAIKSELCVPIKVADQVLGVINVESTKIAYFNTRHEHSLGIIANQMATAFQRLEALETEKKRRRIAETLQYIAAALTTTLNPQKAIELILKELSLVIEFTSASVQLLQGDHLEIVGGRGNLVLDIEKDRLFPYPGNNPNTVVLESMQPYILKDAQADYPGFKGIPSIKSWLGVPLIADERPIGLLTLDSDEPDHFTAEDATLVTSFAHHAAISLKNAQLFEAEQKRRKEAETLRETALAITSSLNLDQAIQQILEQLARVLPYDSAGVQLVKDGYIINLGGRGWSDPDQVMKMRLPIPGDNPNTKVIMERQVVILKDARQEHAPFNEYPHNYIRSWMGVPLIFRDKVIGMLAVDSKNKNYFNEESAAIAQTFAYQAAIAIENARLFDAERKRLQEAEMLRQAAITINSALSLDVVLETVAKQMTEAISSSGCAISAWDMEKNCIYTLVDFSKQHPELTDKADTEYDLSEYPVTRSVLEENKTVVIQRDENNIDDTEVLLMNKQDFALVLMLPMIAGNRTIGLIEVYEDEKIKRETYTEEEIQLIKGLASHAAIAVENARLYNAEQIRRQEAETLRQAAHTISSSLDLHEVLITLLASIRRVIPFTSAAVMLLKNNNQVEITSGYNLPNMEEQIGKTFSSDDALLQELVKTGHPLILPDAQENPHFKKWADTDYVHGWMGIPLIVRAKVIGYITLDSTQVDIYQQKHAELAQVFAHQAASAIENARLYQDAVDAAEKRAVLHRVSQDISRGIQSPDETYLAIHKAAQKMMPCDAFVIAMRSENEDDKDLGVYLIDEGKRYPQKLFPRGKNIISLTEKKGGSFISQDLSTDKLDIDREQSRFGTEKKVRSILVSPMYIGEKLTGAISAQSYSPNAYGKEEQILLEMLASHAAAAIENTRLFEESERRGREFAELYQVSQDLITNQEIDLLLKAMLERATKLVGVSQGCIYINNEKSATLIPGTFYGLNQEDEAMLLAIQLEIGEGLSGRVAQSLEPMRIDNYQQWEGRSSKYENTLPFTSVMDLPLIYQGNLLGILSLFEIAPNKHIFTDNDEQIMTLFAAQVATALHSAKQFEQITTRLAELEAINHLSTSLRTTESSEGMLPTLLDEISHSLHIDTCVIWLSDPNTDDVYKALSRGWISMIPPERQKKDVGIIGRVFTEGQHYISDDIANDPHIKSTRRDLIPQNWTGAWLPIRASHAIIGVIGVMTKSSRQFDSSDLQILRIMAEIAGNALHRSRLHQRTEQQLKRLTALRNIDTSISSHSELHITLQLLVEHAIIQLEVDAASILLVEYPNKNLKYFVGSGFKHSSFKHTLLRAGDGLPNKAIQQRRAIHANNLYEEASLTRRNWFAEENFNFYHCVPLRAKGKVLGVLEIFARKQLHTLPEWLDFLESLAGQAAIAIDNHHLVEDLKKSNEDLAHAYDTTLEGWGKALELRDKDTQGHTLNVTDLTLKLARHMGISENDLIHVYRGALLHDIGKMGIPDNILHKPGPLTKDEWRIMRQHPKFAYEMLSPITYLRPAIDIPYCHHECWDGSGYPRGLKGEDIPLAARVFSVIDVWDALLTDRPYRKAWSQQVVLDYIRNESGTRFDPKIVDVFFKMITQEDD